ncbi:MAG: TonB-dependent receptor [Beijerinckiaceae bacterium]
MNLRQNKSQGAKLGEEMNKFKVAIAAVSAMGSIAAAQQAYAQEAGGNALPEVVISTTPLSNGGGISADKIPALISTVTAKDFEEKHMPSVADAITAHVPGAIAINTDGSDLSPDIFYRGFDASRVSGKAAGLAVYQDGVRINESFGDAVNLDLVPPIAVDHADIFTNNPIFGLNALGGAIAFTMKNGFTFQGGDASVLGGSFGRLNTNLEYGKKIGDYSFYFAGDYYKDNGYRPFGAQNAERFYADLGYRSQDSELHLIGSFGRSLLGVASTTPVVLVNQQYNSVFTTPQTTNNQAGMAQLTGKFDISPKWSIASNFYLRQYDQYHVDGNDANVTDCADVGGPGTSPTTLCAASGGSYPANQYVVNGNPIPSSGANFPYGSVSNTGTHTLSAGTQLQATNKDTFYGHENYFVVGGSVDAGLTNYSSVTTLGQLNSALQVVESGIPGAGDPLNTAGDIGINSTFVHGTATYFGLFSLDTFNITKELALTAGARFNVANVGLTDLTNSTSSLNSSATYNRINPVVGLTYTFAPTLTLYGGYSEANRAPTPLETACSNPVKPCVLENALVSDPPLQQVVSHTYEGGARGTVNVPNDNGTLTYKAGYFHTTSTNDIISEPTLGISGQGYYLNVPETLRQGVEAGVVYNRGPFSFYGNYSYTKATYQFTAILSSNVPGVDGVVPGDNIPGIPRNLGKVGAEYQITPRFKIGGDAIFVGAQYYAGDDANQYPQLPFYYVLNAHASYKVTDNIEVFGLVNNLLNRQYATYGSFYDATGTTSQYANPTLAANATSANPNYQSITVAQPLSVYAGIKVTF